MLRCTRCNMVILMHATAWLLMSFSSCIVCVFDSYTHFSSVSREISSSPPRGGFLCGHLKSTVYESNPHKIQELKDISHAVAAIKITKLYRVCLNMVTARLLTNCSNTPRNIHNNARENITWTRAKRKASYFCVAHSVLQLDFYTPEINTRNMLKYRIKFKYQREILVMIHRKLFVQGQ